MYNRNKKTKKRLKNTNYRRGSHTRKLSITKMLKEFSCIECTAISQQRLHVKGRITRTSKRTQWTVTHVFAIAQAEHTGHAAQVKRNLSPLCSHYQSRPVPPVFIMEEMPPLQSGLQPAPCLGVAMSPARTSALTNTLQWELLISSCGLGEREGRRGRHRVLVSLMERGERNPQPPARKSSCSSSYGSACSCLREGWLAGTWPVGRFYVCACVGRGGEGRGKGEGGDARP